jgi:alpha-L-rhamnosidase
LNGHYLGALEDFAEVLDWLGEKGGEVFRKRASLLRQSLQEHLWDEQKGLFADALINGRLSTQFSEHANAMALAEKVATSEQAQKIIPQMLEKDELNYITRSSGMKMVTPAMSYFLHKGLCEYGQIDASFYLFQRRFDKMLTSEYNGTLWEEWWLDGTGRNGKLVKKTRSDAQTESAFPPALFGAYLLGIQPTSPGWKAAVITPQDNEIMHLEADIPTPEGILKMEWKKMENGSGELTLEIPGEIKISLNHNEFENLSSSPLKINGQIISSMKLKETSSLGKGEHIIQF